MEKKSTKQTKFCNAITWLCARCGNVLDDVPEEASAARYQMLPTKSKVRYQKELEKFTQSQTEKRIKKIDENVMMAFFKNIGATSAGSRYSMLKSTVCISNR
jgi:hypothetical protein